MCWTSRVTGPGKKCNNPPQHSQKIHTCPSLHRAHVFSPERADKRDCICVNRRPMKFKQNHMCISRVSGLYLPLTAAQQSSVPTQLVVMMFHAHRSPVHHLLLQISNTLNPLLDTVLTTIMCKQGRLRLLHLMYCHPYTQEAASFKTNVGFLCCSKAPTSALNTD
ncbi:hypothetical protein INR49_000513 [Caranx melampygus]|nr:hypothetical protein INR49_000513 [Caranx melampygus]